MVMIDEFETLGHLSLLGGDIVLKVPAYLSSCFSLSLFLLDLLLGIQSPCSKQTQQDLPVVGQSGLCSPQSSLVCDGVGKSGEPCPVGSAVVTSERTKEASLGSQIPAVFSNPSIKVTLILFWPKCIIYWELGLGGARFTLNTLKNVQDLCSLQSCKEGVERLLLADPQASGDVCH